MNSAADLRNMFAADLQMRKKDEFSFYVAADAQITEWNKTIIFDWQ